MRIDELRAALLRFAGLLTTEAEPLILGAGHVVPTERIACAVDRFTSAAFIYTDLGEDNSYVDVVFDGPPGPESCRFVEVEDPAGRSIRLGEWVQRKDGFWALRLPCAFAPVVLRNE